MGRYIDPLKPIIRSAVTGNVYPDTREGRRQLDEDEGRIRIPNSAMEAITVLQACQIMARRCAEALAPTIRKTGKGKMIKAQAGGLRRSVSDIMTKVSAVQCRSLDANTQNQTITVTSSKIPSMINIDVEDMEHICNRALEMCSFSCDCTREQSKACRLREAFEQVTVSLGGADGSDPSKCPFAGQGVVINAKEDEQNDQG